ncbi:hypothetical protein [Pseudomonas sp. NPDC096950]|uniref:hypothetical protein n=1 Tax=Pseudomonas sp. NPDC096950 TaxID=3364485 RepID=UPI00383A4EE6
MTTQQLNESYTPTESQLNDPKKKVRPNHYRTAMGMIFAAILAGISGAFIAGWWFLDLLTHTEEVSSNPVQVKIFTEMSSKSLVAALVACGLLLLVLALEVYGAWKASKRTPSTPLTAMTTG